jgi:hypothetical protein
VHSAVHYRSSQLHINKIKLRFAIDHHITMSSVNNRRIAKDIPDYHECPEWDRCNEQPCCYAITRDPDYRADLSDLRRNPVYHLRLWTLFWFPSARAKASAEELLVAIYSAKFDRCQRLDDKRKKIDEEIKLNETRFLRGLGLRMEPDPEWMLNDEEVSVFQM